jgi:hypothetical protein
MAGRGPESCGTAGRGGLGVKRLGKARSGLAVEVCRGVVGSGPVRCGLVGQGGYGQSWSVKVRSGVVRRSWCGSARSV